MSTLHGPFINGEFLTQGSDRPFAVINPSSEAVIAEIAHCGLAEVDLAVAAARAALNGPWGAFDARQRQNCLLELAALIDSHNAELATLETENTGKTLFESSKVEIPLVAEIFRYFAGFATKSHGTTSSNPTSLRMTLREPVGVCGLIVPWNFPLLMAAWKIAPALAFGNTVVVKPSELTPLSLLKLAQLSLMAKIPNGVLNVVPGLGTVAGAALVAHPGVDKISFTGSTRVGEQIMKACANPLKRVSLELGGKSPNIIFEDANLKAAIRGAYSGIFYNKGEVCAAGSRVLVQKSIYTKVVDELSKMASECTLGDPKDKLTRMGPVISNAQMTKVMGYVEQGVDEGATLKAGGTRATSVNGGKGFFVTPTVFADVNSRMKIAQDEIFGPVVAVIPFEDEAHAIQIANDNAYGLAAGVWTSDIKRALRVAKAVKSGTVWINTYNLYDPDQSFGGVKSSGFGRELGTAALEQYTELKSLWIDLT
jgi:acyl-CoA reductase-like NAD-dependent aldehyde dehydrogenase